jgi:hypothetical protein
MKSKLTFAVPLRRELADLATRLKHDDVEELKAASGRTPEEVMADLAEHGYGMIGAYFDNKLEAVFGVNKNGYPEGMAAVWLLSSDALKHHAKSLLKISRDYLDAWQCYGTLFNFVDARAVRSLRWLKRVGFKFTYIPSHGTQGLPFVLITRG